MSQNRVRAQGGDHGDAGDEQHCTKSSSADQAHIKMLSPVVLSFRISAGSRRRVKQAEAGHFAGCLKIFGESSSG